MCARRQPDTYGDEHCHVPLRHRFLLRSSASPGRAAKDYLRILELAAKESEAGVDAALARLLEWNVPITPTVVADRLAHDLGLPRAMEVMITAVDLSMYDELLESKEDMPLADQSTCMSP